MRVSLIVILFCFGHSGTFAKDVPLPTQLSLEDAISLSLKKVPQYELALAQQELAAAKRLDAETLSAISLTATGSLRVIDPASLSVSRNKNDSQMHLVLRKRLFDFGHSDSLVMASKSAYTSSTEQVQQSRQQQQLDVMQAFFDVILSDLAYARDNEAMTVAYLQSDRAGDRNELGQLSDVDLLEKQATYEKFRQKRLMSETQQRLTRSRLAIVMGRPDELASNLIMPNVVLPEKDDNIFEKFWQKVEEFNLDLSAYRYALKAAHKAVVAARSGNGPVVSAELEAAAYQRDSSSRHPLAAGLVLEWPLLDGGKRKAAIASALAKQHRVNAEMNIFHLKLRQQALEMWLQRDLIRSEIQELTVLGDFRDLYLDRSRARYELELKTDLGDAMMQTSAVRYRMAASLFGWKMLEAKMAALSGQLLGDENEQ